MPDDKAKDGEPPRAALNQHERFIETARKLGVDEDEAAFKEKLAVIARQKPKEPGPPPKE